MGQHIKQSCPQGIIIGGWHRLSAELLEGHVAISTDNRCSPKKGCAESFLNRSEINQINIIERGIELCIWRENDIFGIDIPVNNRGAE